MGVEHPSVITHGIFLSQYDRLFTHLESKIDQLYGRRLGPSLVAFHVQLIWRNYLVVILDAGETEHIDPPDFKQDLTMLEVQNMFLRVPTVNNISAFSALQNITRLPGPAVQPHQTRGLAIGMAIVEPAVPCRKPKSQSVQPSERRSLRGQHSIGV
jgi:hypothetical protein